MGGWEEGREGGNIIASTSPEWLQCAVFLTASSCEKATEVPLWRF